MKILMIADNDPAGMGIAFTNAINRHTEHTCRLVTCKTVYNFDFEKDIHIPDLSPAEFDQVSDLLKEADIIHFHTLVDETWHLGPIHIKDCIKEKTIVHHHHGHPEFRAHPMKFQEKYFKLRRKALVSTPDLLRLMPEATWQPNLVPVLSPLYTPLPEGIENGHVRVAHSPTRSELKNTGEFQRVMSELKTVLRNTTDVIIRDTLHSDCLRLKRSCHIHFDHMQGYFGVSSLEGLSQGKPVIAGLDDWNVRHILETSGAEEVPWIIATNETELSRVLTLLIESPEERKARGEYSRRFMESYWSDNQVIDKLIYYYISL